MSASWRDYSAFRGERLSAGALGWGAGVLPGAIVQEHVVAFAKRRGVAITWGESLAEPSHAARQGRSR